MTTPTTQQGVTLREALERSNKVLRAAADKTADALIANALYAAADLNDADISQPPAPEQSGGDPDLEKIIDSFVADYELNDGEAFHRPSEFERLLIKDAIMGLLVDAAWDSAWGDHIKSLATPTAGPAGDAVAVPHGYALIPLAVTEAMHVAAIKVLLRAQGNDALPQRMLSAMLSASPAAPEAANPCDGQACIHCEPEHGCKQTKPEQPAQAGETIDLTIHGEGQEDGHYVRYERFLKAIAKKDAALKAQGEALNYIVGCSVPMTPQQSEAWPVMRAAIALGLEAMK